jgi:putative endonuclease
MKKYFCYILFSSSLNKYYIGETEDLQKRLIEHNTRLFKDAYTSIADDWQVFLSIACHDRIQAKKVEAFIKRMKSRKFIEKLKDSMQMQEDILNKCR